MNDLFIRSALFAVLTFTTAACSATADDGTDDANVSPATTASTQTREHILLARTNYTRDLSNLANAMGTRDGRIVVVDAAGGQRTFAVNGETYFSGATVLGDARRDLCEESRAGLTSCTSVASATSSTAYECDDDACECTGALDCLGMAFSGACSEGTIVCDASSCFCDR